MDTCIICQTEHFEPIYDGILKKCTHCGFVTATVSINLEDILPLYGESYFKGDEYVDYVSDKLVHQHNFNDRLDRVDQVIQLKKCERILEIGCAYGFFGEIVRERIENVEYKGYDISESAIKYASEEFALDMIHGDYSTTQELMNPTDVFLFDVIEHMVRPDLILAKINKDMSPKGRLYITTGDIDTWLPRMRKDKWRMIHPPTHLHYFSKKTLTKLLNNNGFQVIDVSYPAIRRSLRLIFYSLFLLRKQKSSFYHWIFQRIPESWQIAVNTKDVMFVIAVKEKDV